MRSLRVACLTVAAALVATLSTAQDPVIARVVIWKAKPGMEAKLEAGIKAHNEFHRKQGDPLDHQTYVVSSGPDTGHYVRVAGGRNWKDFDAEAAWDQADQADSAINTDPYIESAMLSYYRMREDLSHGAPGAAPAPMYSLTFYRVRFDKVDDFVDAWAKAKEAAVKAQWPRHVTVFSLVSGGDGPTWVLSQPRTKFADFNPLSKTFAAVLEEQLGKEAATARMQKLNASVEGTFTQIVTYRGDLSYVPAKK